MAPRKEESNSLSFSTRLEKILSNKHPLYILADKIDWSVFEKGFGSFYHEKAGRPGLSIRLLVGLHYLKHTYDVSDEGVLEQFLENPYWQYFCGYEYFQHQFPCDPTSLVKWRKRIGSDGLEKLLKETIDLGKREKFIDRNEFNRVNVDTTVQEKAIAFPTDARLSFKMLRLLVKAAKSRGIELRQSYKRKAQVAYIMQSRYARAKQFKRARRETKRLRIYMGRIMRDIQRKELNPDSKLKDLLEKSNILFNQKKTDTNKLYSIHAPEVECISKGKAHKKYEFGCKVSLVTSSRNNWILGIQALSGNPYDGHTLASSIEQMKKICEVEPKEIYADKGYKGKTGISENIQLHISGKSKKNMTLRERKWMKRRSAIEPIISHAKHYHRMDRNYLLGREGDKMNAILAGIGCNLRKLFRAFFFPILKLDSNQNILINFLFSLTPKPKLLLFQG